MSSEVPLQVYGDNESRFRQDNLDDVNGEFTMTRSVDMQYITITIPNEVVTQVVNGLGDFGFVHVVDLSSSGEMSKHQFAFKKRTTDVADIEKKIKYFEDQMKSRNVKIEFEDFDNQLGEFGDIVYNRNPDVVLGGAEFVGEIETQLNSNISFERSVQTELARRREMVMTLEASRIFVPQNSSAGSDLHDLEGGNNLYNNFMNSSNAAVRNSDSGLSSYICGVIPVAQQAVFSRLIHRTARGSNAVVKFGDSPVDVVDPTTNETVKKTVFCVVTIGSELYSRVHKICPLVNATIYPIPAGNETAVRNELSRLESEIREQELALSQTQNAIKRILGHLAEPREINNSWGPCILRAWQQVLFRERVVIDTLMKCDVHATLYLLGGWCPKNRIYDLCDAVSAACRGAGAKAVVDRHATVPKEFKIPPTLINNNKFVDSFQAIINTYGFPQYGEFNPGLFTVILFPFLFGVMYGDVGHGIMILLIALLFIAFEKSLLRAEKEKTMNEMISMVFSGRYVLLFMGMMAIYCGVIYNDVMSIPMNLFGTSFHEKIYTTKDETSGEDVEVIEYVWSDKVYPFGVDPAWYHKKNSLKFFNSFKMKIAVIIGVIQMIFGMFLSLYNHIYFNNILAIFFEFLPRLLFFVCLFGYMITMIFIKWCSHWPGGKGPNLIQTMIDMFLSPGSVSEEALLYSGQDTIQLALLFVAVICIPWMLLPKPFIEWGKSHGGCKAFSACHSPADDEYLLSQTELSKQDDVHMRGLGSDDVDISSSDESSPSAHSSGDNHEEHSFSDVMIHQGIHTIEFILGAVSNTASYLRLWALSLAHAQLAEVFWEKMASEYGYDKSGVFSFIGTAVWAAATFGVILCMDALECYLHALRLIWVEWNSKYYIGNGYVFKALSFKKVE